MALDLLQLCPRQYNWMRANIVLSVLLATGRLEAAMELTRRNLALGPDFEGNLIDRKPVVVFELVSELVKRARAEFPKDTPQMEELTRLCDLVDTGASVFEGTLDDLVLSPIRRRDTNYNDTVRRRKARKHANDGEEEFVLDSGFESKASYFASRSKMTIDVE